MCESLIVTVFICPTYHMTTGWVYKVFVAGPNKLSVSLKFQPDYGYEAIRDAGVSGLTFGLKKNTTFR